MYLSYRGLFAAARDFYFRKVIDRFCRGEAGVRLLDYGCGPGDMLVACRERGIDAVGVDSSDYSVTLAAKRGLTVIKGDHTSSELIPGTFDVIFMQSVLEHLTDPVATLAALRALLKPGGRLIVSAPTPASNFWDDPTHVRPHTPKSLEVIATLCELEVVYVSYVFAFLLGLTIRTPFVYKLLNVLPLSLGTNLVCVYRRPA